MVAVIIRIPAVGPKPAFEIRREISVPNLLDLDGLKEVCQIGDQKTIQCPDGSKVITTKCEKDPTTGYNRWVITGNTCPTPEMGKNVKILTGRGGSAIEAYDGMDVSVIAAATCGLSASNGEEAIFSVDGNEISRGITSAGFVTFTWKATVEPSRTHKLCVSIPKSSKCSEFGEARDCKTITVSRSVPNLEERLIKERETYISQLEAQRIEREKIRELSMLAGATPTPYIETSPIIPENPPIADIVPPVVDQVPAMIDIPAVGMPPENTYPILIKIDGKTMGPLPIRQEVTPGTHTVAISLKGFPPITMKPKLTAGQILTINESFVSTKLGVV